MVPPPGPGTLSQHNAWFRIRTDVPVGTARWMSRQGPPPDEHPPRTSLERTFSQTLASGYHRLSRPWHTVLATGLMGGLEVGTGVLALLYTLHVTGNHLLAGLAFSIGFLALLLGQSELFTENFLVPVTAVATRLATLGALLRLWGFTLVMNLLGGWVVTWLIIRAFPELHRVAARSGNHFAELGVTLSSFCLAVLAGSAITLMTWMQLGADSEFGRIIAAIAVGFLISGTQLFHAVLDSLLMFAALHTPLATFGYLDFFIQLGWAALGNMVGGIGMVTGLRLVQVRPLKHRLGQIPPQ